MVDDLDDGTTAVFPRGRVVGALVGAEVGCALAKVLGGSGGNTTSAWFGDGEEIRALLDSIALGFGFGLGSGMEKVGKVSVPTSNVSSRLTVRGEEL